MKRTFEYAPALDQETIDAMDENLKYKVLGELAYKLGRGGITQLSEYYHVDPSLVSKGKRAYEEKLKMDSDN